MPWSNLLRRAFSRFFFLMHFESLRNPGLEDCMVYKGGQ